MAITIPMFETAPVLTPAPTPPVKLTILLDLNFTFVENSKLKFKQGNIPYGQKINSETYRQWLVELMRPHTVLLCTVRHQKYATQTIERIEALTGWKPDGWFFNPTDIYDGSIVKAEYLSFDIFPKFGMPQETQYMALESAAKTRTMYKRNGVPVFKVPYDHQWLALPTIS